MFYNKSLMENTNTGKQFPVYVVLFSNDTDFGKVIRKTTGQEFSHAAISLDPSLNNMYSFSSIPYSRKLENMGFVKESLWSPMFQQNRYFVVCVTFVDEAGYKEIQQKIDYFVKNHTKFKYNTRGLIQYYLNFKERKNYSEQKKLKWFCSEFVAYMLRSGKRELVDDIMQSPGDLVNINDIHILKKYTIDSFDEQDLVKETDLFISSKMRGVKEELEWSEVYGDGDILYEKTISELVREISDKWNDNEISKVVINIDWKRLHDEYVRLFKTDPVLRFNLIELIIRERIIKGKKKVDNITDYIVDEMKAISNALIKITGVMNGAVVEVKKLIVKAQDLIVEMPYPDAIEASNK